MIECDLSTNPQTTYATEFFNRLPYGYAIQIQKFAKWDFFNKALQEDLLKTEDFSQAVKRMDEISEMVKEKNKGISDGTETIVELTNSPTQASASANNYPLAPEYFVSVRKSSWKNQDAFFYSVVDLSKIKKEEYRKAVLAERGRMLRSLSHELRTPINGTLNSLEQCKQLLEAAGNKEVLENLNIAVCSTNLLLNKYNDFLVN